MPAHYPTLEDLSQRLREFLHAHDLGQREAASILGIPQSTLSRVVSGHDLRYSAGIDLLNRMDAHAAKRPRLDESARVQDIMTRPVLGIDPACTLKQALAFLARHDYSHAPLQEGPRRFGPLVSRRKVSDALAAGTPRDQTVGASRALVLDGEPGRVHGHDYVSIIPALLKTSKLVLVTSSAGNVKGVVTAANMSLLAPDANLNQRARASNSRSGG